MIFAAIDKRVKYRLRLKNFQLPLNLWSRMSDISFVIYWRSFDCQLKDRHDKKS